MSHYQDCDSSGAGWESQSHSQPWRKCPYCFFLLFFKNALFFIEKNNLKKKSKIPNLAVYPSHLSHLKTINTFSLASLSSQSSSSTYCNLYCWSPISHHLISSPSFLGFDEDGGFFVQWLWRLKECCRYCCLRRRHNDKIFLFWSYSCCKYKFV